MRTDPRGRRRTPIVCPTSHPRFTRRPHCDIPRIKPTAREYFTAPVSPPGMTRTIALLGISISCHLFAQVEPGAGQWKTWVLPNGSALRLPPPPDTTAAELQTMKDLITQRNQAALATIEYWDA